MSKKKYVASWRDIPDKTMATFRARVEKLIDALPVDSDGDAPVSVLIVDRRNHEGIHFVPVPYDFDQEDTANPRVLTDSNEEQWERHRRAVLLNYEIAAHRMELMNRIDADRRHEERKRRELERADAETVARVLLHSLADKIEEQDLIDPNRLRTAIAAARRITGKDAT